MRTPRDDLPVGLLARGDAPPVEWRVSERTVPYELAVAVMDARAQAIAAGRARELVWLLEHPPLYTAGTSARSEHLIEERFPVFASSRGGQFTYHGPGQRVAYLMLDLKRRANDVRRYVATLEAWLIRTLANFGVRAERREDRVGLWVPRPEPGREDKIVAIGVRVRQHVTLHGISLNVDPELAHFSGIVPCGVASQEHGVTSLARLGCSVEMPEIDEALRREFEPLFGPTAPGAGRLTDPNALLASACGSAALPQAVGNTENRSPL
jgi:lipoyl(octanoyl) transferase